MTPSFELIIFGIAIVVWIFSSLAKGIKWLSGRMNGANARPSLVQQAADDAQRLQQAVVRPRPANPLSNPPINPQTLPQRVPPLFGRPAGPAPPRVTVPARAIMPRQPSAGGPAVPFETDSADFARQERTIQAEEPPALGVPLSSDTSLATRRVGPLFGNVDDLVRALILQEALGPPLSRRQGGAPAPPPPA